jgi:hypothetical protein
VVAAGAQAIDRPGSNDAELGEKQIGFGGVLVFCNGASISLLDESIGYQAIESRLLPLSRLSAFFTLQPATISQRIASSSLVMVTASVI